MNVQSPEFIPNNSSFGSSNGDAANASYLDWGCQQQLPAESFSPIEGPTLVAQEAEYDVFTEFKQKPQQFGSLFEDSK